MSAETNNEHLVRQMFEMLSTRNLDGLREIFHVEVTWEPMAKSIPGSDAIKGRDKTIDGFFPSVLGLFQPGHPKIHVLRIFSSDEWVAAETANVGMLANGKEYNNRYAWIIEVRAGQIYTVRAYTDGAYVLTRLR